MEDTIAAAVITSVFMMGVVMFFIGFDKIIAYFDNSIQPRVNNWYKSLSNNTKYISYGIIFLVIWGLIFYYLIP